MRIHVSVRDAAIAFTGGAILALGAAHWFLRLGGTIGLAGLAIVFALAGWFAGWSFDRGLRGSIAASLMFLILGPLLTLVLLGTQAMTGRETFREVLPPSCFYFTVTSAVAATVGTAISGLGWRAVVAGVLGFATGGLLGGVAWALVVTTTVIALKAGSNTATPLLLGHAVATALPFALGGAAIAFALEPDEAVPEGNRGDSPESSRTT